MLFINNEDVQKVLTIEDTLRVLEAGHEELAKQELVARPRIDIYTETDRATSTAGGRWKDPARDYIAMPFG
jgi:hypothetical protein